MSEIQIFKSSAHSHNLCYRYIIHRHQIFKCTNPCRCVHTHSHAHLCTQPQIYTGMLCPLFKKSVLWENSVLELSTYFCITNELFTNSAENMFLLLPSLLSVPSAIQSPVLYTALSRWCLAPVTWKCCASVGFYGNVWGSSTGALCTDLTWPTPWQRAFSFWGAASKLWCR